MAKNQFHTGHQKGIIKRYYENKEDINTNKISEIVSDLYLATKPMEQLKLWKQAGTALHNILDAKDGGKEKVELVIKSRDLKKLAELASEVF